MWEWVGRPLQRVTHLDVPGEIHTVCTSTSPTQSEKRRALINTHPKPAQMVLNNLVLFSGENLVMLKLMPGQGIFFQCSLLERSSWTAQHQISPQVLRGGATAPISSALTRSMRSWSSRPLTTFPKWSRLSSPLTSSRYLR